MERERLFKGKLWLSGVASVLDLGGAFRTDREQMLPEEEDAEALASDWRAVGGDLWEAEIAFAHEASELVSGDALEPTR